MHPNAEHAGHAMVVVKDRRHVVGGLPWLPALGSRPCCIRCLCGRHHAGRSRSSGVGRFRAAAACLPATTSKRARVVHRPDQPCPTWISCSDIVHFASPAAFQDAAVSSLLGEVATLLTSVHERCGDEFISALPRTGWPPVIIEQLAVAIQQRKVRFSTRDAAHCLGFVTSLYASISCAAGAPHAVSPYAYLMSWETLACSGCRCAWLRWTGTQRVGTDPHAALDVLGQDQKELKAAIKSVMQQLHKAQNEAIRTQSTGT